MPPNVVPAVPLMRQPRALVRIGGQTVPGWISWNVDNNSWYEADTFRVSFAASALPSTNNAKWFSQQREIFLEILSGLPADPTNPTPAELVSLIYGRVDDIRWRLDVEQGQIIDLTGRDLTAAFIDAKTTQTYQNKTSSQIAATLAAAHGLQSVITPTTIKVGTYYDNEQVRLQANRSEWDLLAWLAREEGYVVYVLGQTLYFTPDPTDTSNPYVIYWRPPTSTQGSAQSNVTSLEFSRSLTVAKGIAVTAKSPSLTSNTPTVQSYPSAAKAIQAGKSSPFGHVQNYYFTMAPGKTAVQVQQFAERMYAEIVAHEMKMTARLPGDDTLTIGVPILVTGTGTDFDQIYYPRLVSREMSIDQGYLMTVEAQNVNPDTSPQS